MAGFVGTARNDTLVGSAASDLIYGEDGNDILTGLAGPDVLSGGSGDDTLLGGLGRDTLKGGLGSDIFRYASLLEMNGDTILDFAVGDTLDLSAIAGLQFLGDLNFQGNAGEVRLVSGSASASLQVDTDGDGEANATLTLSGNLRLVETAPGSRILQAVAPVISVGTAAADALSGGAADDVLTGAAGHDSLFGGAGNDSLSGGTGDDLLTGGRGADTLTGGSGSDTFRYLDFDEIGGDLIRDFGAEDRIDLSALSALRFVGDADFSGAAGEIRQSGNLLLVDTDGDRIANLTLTGIGTGMLTETAAGSRILVTATPVVNAGTAGNDVLAGGAAADRLSGDLGHDRISGGGGSDRLLGEEGNDTLDGGSGNDTLEGGSGSDSLIGGTGQDMLSGGSANDTLEGGAGSDTLRGGAGSDSFVYASAEDMTGDVILDFSVGDRIDLSAITGLTFIGNEAFSAGGTAEVRFDNSILYVDRDGNGTAEASVSVVGSGLLPLEETSTGSRILQIAVNRSLAGGTAAEFLSGGGGNDTVDGGGGDDTLVGGAGADSLLGGAGDDSLLGGAGNDTLLGGVGNDTLDGGTGTNSLSGGAGNDRFVMAPGSGGTIVDLDAGDRIDLTGLPRLAWLGDAAFSGVRAEMRQERSGTDTILQIDANGDGFAETTLLLRNAGSLVETAAGSRILQLAAGMVFVGSAANETRAGGAGDDSLSGGGGNDSLLGGAGADTLDGGDGKDTLAGGTGDDQLAGGAGDDLLIAALGEDTITGGAGNDMIRYTRAAEAAGDVITDLAAGDLLDLSGIAEFSFVEAGLTGAGGEFTVLASYAGVSIGKTFVAFDSDGDGFADAVLTLNGDLALEERTAGSRILTVAPNLALSGDARANALAGRAGNDSLSGVAGHDTLSGLGGNDTLDGGEGNDSLLGGLGDDSLLGGLGADTLDGGAGNDTLAGGDDADRLLGGDGSDSLAGGAGDDTLLGGLGADTLFGGAGNDTFTYLSAMDMASDMLSDFAVGDRLDLSALKARFVGTAMFAADGTAQIRQDGAYVYSNSDGGSYTAYSLFLGTLASGVLEETAAGSGILQRVPNLSLTGGDGADSLTGRQGNDTITGGGGNDTLDGGAGADSLSGGDGNDSLVGGAGNDVLVGGAGDDIIVVGSGNDTVTGGIGNDTIRIARDGASLFVTITDFAMGDRIDFSATGWTYIGTGAFTGTGRAEYRLSGSRFEVDLGGNGSASSSISVYSAVFVPEETALGSGLFELPPVVTATGSAGSDTIAGRGNNDLLSGGAGNDTLVGLAGNDTIDGGEGNDSLVGGAGSDRLTGGAGDDTIVIGSGYDTVMGGAGNDLIVVAPASGEYFYTTLEDFATGDRLDFSRLGLSYVGDAAFSAAGGGELRLVNNVFYLDFDGNGSYEGSVSLQYGLPIAPDQTAPGSGLFEVAAPVIRTGGNGADSLAGRGNADSLVGGNGDDTLSGLGGNDTLDGGADADILLGGQGSDSLIGGAGNDKLTGGVGSDTLTGGMGSDTFVYLSTGDVSGDMITDFGAGDLIDLSALGVIFQAAPKAGGGAQAWAVKSGFSTYLYVDANGDGFSEALLSLTGALSLEETKAGSGVLQIAVGKVLNGGASADVLSGGAGNDTLSGGDGADSLSGLLGDDSLLGGTGNDTLDGGADADTLIGGAGADVLTGGAGADRFVFANGEVGTGAMADSVTDFNAYDGDRLDLSGIDANTAMAGDQAFNSLFSSSAAFTSAGQLFFDAGTYTLLGNTDGDAEAEFAIRFTAGTSVPSYGIIA